MTNTPTEDASGDDRPDPPLRGGRRRHHPRVLPDRRQHRGAEGDRPRGERADRRRHPLPLQARARGRRRRRRVPAHQPRQHRLGRAGPRSHRRGASANGCAIRIGVNAGSLEKDLLEKYGEPCPEALVESALDHIRILEDHGFRELQGRGEGQRRVPRRRRLPAARRPGRLPAPPRHHRGRRPDRRHGQVRDRHRLTAVGRDRRHHPRLALGRAGGRGPRRLRDPEERSASAAAASASSPARAARARAST